MKVEKDSEEVWEEQRSSNVHVHKQAISSTFSAINTM